MNETQLENTCLDWFRESGWDVVYGPDIAPDSGNPARSDYREVLLKSDLEEATAQINTHLPPWCTEQILAKIQNHESLDLLTNNRAFHNMLLEGVPVEYKVDDKLKHDHAFLIDFEDITKNKFLAINQFTIIGTKQSRRPDIICFINGLPIAVLELKSHTDENCDIWDALNQIGTYKNEISDLFVFNEALIISDGYTARVGSLTANQERFMPWRTIKNEDDKPLLEWQLKTSFGGIIDLLVIDRSGDLVILELKKARTPRDVVAQTVDYASWVRRLTTSEIYDISQAYLKHSLNEKFKERFDTNIPETLNSNHSMVIIASELDESSKRIVEYLAEEHNMSINTAFFNVFQGSEGQFLVSDWLMDQQTVMERYESKRKAPWSGLWFVNVGEDEHKRRRWEDYTKYGFIAAGGGRFYSKRLSQLSPGDEIYAYQKGVGYVGHGIVTSEEAVMAKDFMVDGKPLLELPLKASMALNKDDPELAEYVVGIEWKKAFSMNSAKRFKGAFANQNIVCKLRDEQTIDFLKSEFK